MSVENARQNHETVRLELEKLEGERANLNKTIHDRLRDDARGGQAYPENEHQKDLKALGDLDFKIERLKARTEAAQEALENEKREQLENAFRERVDAAKAIQREHAKAFEKLNRQLEEVARQREALAHLGLRYEEALSAARGPLFNLRFRREYLSPEEEARITGELPLDREVGRRYRVRDLAADEIIDNTQMGLRIREALGEAGCHPKLNA